MKEVIKPALIEANCAREVAASRVHLMETMKAEVESKRKKLHEQQLLADSLEQQLEAGAKKEKASKKSTASTWMSLGKQFEAAGASACSRLGSLLACTTVRLRAYNVMYIHSCVSTYVWRACTRQ